MKKGQAHTGYRVVPMKEITNKRYAELLHEEEFNPDFQIHERRGDVVYFLDEKLGHISYYLRTSGWYIQRAQKLYRGGPQSFIRWYNEARKDGICPRTGKYL